MGLLRRRGTAADPVDGRNGRRFAVGFFLAIFLLLGALYAAGYAFTSDRVPQQVSVSGDHALARTGDRTLKHAVASSSSGTAFRRSVGPTRAVHASM